MQLILVVLSFCCLAAALQEAEIKQQWLSFRSKYDRKYRNVVESNQRFVIFKRNLKRMWLHNKRFEQGMETYEMAVSPFSDMDMKEIEKSYMGLKITEKDEELFQNSTFYEPSIQQRSTLPSYVDWRESGAITAVKDQKSCGSCWAFASVGALEAHYFLKYKQSVLLSEQNLVDCVAENWGCDGGWMVPSFNYVRENFGINTESVYPYEAVDGVCRHQPYNGVTNHGYMVTNPDNEDHLQFALAFEGPVTVSIHVNDKFVHYKSGIFDDPDCSQMANHAVLVVGYGTENGQDYWLIKNSWGTHWGDNGYVKMARNKGSQCAIAKHVSYPVF